MDQENVRLYKLSNEQRFDLVCVFTNFKMNGTLLSENDKNINGKYHQDPVKAFLTVDSVKLIIVADKLQTGFDVPQLGIMYVDKVLRGAQAVQTLGRLSRVAEGKNRVVIIDFKNTKDDILKSYQDFAETERIYDDEENWKRETQNESNNPMIKGLVEKMVGVSLSENARNLATKLWGASPPRLKKKSSKSHIESRISEEYRRPKVKKEIKTENENTSPQEPKKRIPQKKIPSSNQFRKNLAKQGFIPNASYVPLAKKRKIDETGNTNTPFRRQRRFKPNIKKTSALLQNTKKTNLDKNKFSSTQTQPKNKKLIYQINPKILNEKKQNI